MNIYTQDFQKFILKTKVIYPLSQIYEELTWVKYPIDVIRAWEDAAVKSWMGTWTQNTQNKSRPKGTQIFCSKILVIPTKKEIYGGINH